MGKAKTVFDCFDPFTQTTIRSQAARVVRSAGLPRHEQKDLEQDLRVHLLERRSHFDPDRGAWHAFVRCVVQRKALNLLDTSRRRKRAQGRQSVSLSAEPPGEQGDLGERLDQDGYLRRSGHPNPSFIALRHQRIDVSRAMTRLERRDRALARLLMFEQIADVARRTGIPRSTLYERIKKIRGQFEEEGLRDYLDESRRFLPRAGN